MWHSVQKIFNTAPTIIATLHLIGFFPLFWKPIAAARSLSVSAVVCVENGLTIACRPRGSRSAERKQSIYCILRRWRLFFRRLHSCPPHSVLNCASLPPRKSWEKHWNQMRSKPQKDRVGCSVPVFYDNPACHSLRCAVISGCEENARSSVCGKLGVI